MGMTSKPTGLADALFSTATQRLLALLFAQPERQLGSAELIARAGIGTGATHRQLQRMLRVELITVARFGNQRHYRANPLSPIFKELVAISQKTVGLVGPLGDALAPLGDQICAAFVFGSVANHTDRATSDIDLMVISDSLSYATLFDSLIPVEQLLARTVSLKLLTLEEFRQKRSVHASLVAEIANGARTFVVGSADDLT